MAPHFGTTSFLTTSTSVSKKKKKNGKRIQILESFNYFSLSITAADYLTGEFGVPDVQAGSIYGAWGMLIVLYGVLGGAVIDAVGIRGCLMFSAAATGAARTALALTRSKGVALFCFFVPAAVGGALGVPVLTIGVKRCSPPHPRGFAFSIFYVSSFSFRERERESKIQVPVQARRWSPWETYKKKKTGRDEPRRARRGSPPRRLPRPRPSHREVQAPSGPEGVHGPGGSCGGPADYRGGLFRQEREVARRRGGSVGAGASSSSPAATTGAAGGPSAAAAATEGSVSAVNLLPRGATRSSVSLDGVSLENGDGVASPETAAAAAAATDADETASASKQHRRKSRFFSSHFYSSLLKRSWVAATSTLRAVAGPELHKFVAMSILTVNLKSIFRHLDTTLPKFVARAFGCSAPAGSIYSINPAMIMTLVPVVGAALSWLEPFDAIHYGGYISAGSPLAIAASPTLGGTAGFVALLSVGEAIWSPRW